jgi:hypothetical protein
MSSLIPAASVLAGGPPAGGTFAVGTFAAMFPRLDFVSRSNIRACRSTDGFHGGQWIDFNFTTANAAEQRVRRIAAASAAAARTNSRILAERASVRRGGGAAPTATVAAIGSSDRVVQPSAAASPASAPSNRKGGTPGSGSSNAAFGPRAFVPVLAKLPEGSIAWARSSYYHPTAIGSLFEGTPRSKRAWIDPVRCFCHLCQEPVSNMLTHACWWDHVTLHWSIRHLSSVWRVWSPRRVEVDYCLSAQQRRRRRPAPPAAPASAEAALLSHARATLPPFGGFLKQPRANPHPHSPFPAILQVEKCDETRRMELAALIRSLNRPPFSCVSFSFKDQRSGAVGQGERMFRAEVSRLCQTMIPPCSAETMTRLQQKCWGRKNLEILFDRLQLGQMMEEGGMQAATTKDHKGAILRQLFFELVMGLSDETAAWGDVQVRSVLPPLAADGPTAPHMAASSVGHNPVRPSAAAPSAAAAATGSNASLLPGPVFADVRQMLIEQTLHRMAFELVYVRTMILLDTAAPTWMKLGPPSNDEMEASGYF